MMHLVSYLSKGNLNTCVVPSHRLEFMLGEGTRVTNVSPFIVEGYYTITEVLLSHERVTSVWLPNQEREAILHYLAAHEDKNNQWVTLEYTCVKE